MQAILYISGLAWLGYSMQSEKTNRPCACTLFGKRCTYGFIMHAVHVSSRHAALTLSDSSLLQVVFYDLNGREVRAFDYSADDSMREFSSCAFNPSGDTVVMGNYNRFLIYAYNMQRSDWEEVGHKQVSGWPVDVQRQLPWRCLKRSCFQGLRALVCCLCCWEEALQQSLRPWCKEMTLSVSGCHQAPGLRTRHCISIVQP